MTWPPRIAPLGDAALTITFGPAIDSAAATAVARLAASATARPPRGLVELVPGYTTLTAHFDLLATSFRQLADDLTVLAAGPSQPDPGSSNRLIEIRVRYDGPDLADVAARAGLSPAEVIGRHSALEYCVALLGFVPGFGYLGPIDPALVLPRRASPRTRVPAGSVAIGGAQTGIYPAETPGGWHLIGRTTAVMFDPARQPPALLAVGDRVRFVEER